MAKHQQINGKRPVTSFCTNRATYFDCGDAKQFDVSQLLVGTDWQLFAFDFERREALFVRVSPGADLFEAPFLHQELYSRACELVALPFDGFLALSKRLVEPQTTVHVLSIGRCGSTLAHHLFHNASGVLSVSEPDTYIGLTMMRNDLDEDESVALLKAANSFHFRSGAQRGDHTLVVKHHSQTLFIAERLRMASPNAKFMFMYREGESWANSVCQMAQSYGFPILQDRSAREKFWHIVSGGQDSKTVVDFIDPAHEEPEGDRWIAALWAVYLTEYLRLWADQFRMLAINYRDLNGDRMISVERVFKYCGLATNHLAQVLTAFDKDSQAGTSLAKDRKTAGFSETNYQNFRDTLAKFKTIESSGMLLPSL